MSSIRIKLFPQSGKSSKKSKSLVRCGYEALKKALFQGRYLFRKYLHFYFGKIKNIRISYLRGVRRHKESAETKDFFQS